MDFKKKIDDGILEKLVHINRITKVVKGGRRFGFSALVVVGNQAGKIGIAHAKAKQVPDAIKKANETARRKLIHIPLREGRTIHHDVYGKDGAGKIILRSAPKGTGIIAGGRHINHECRLRLRCRHVAGKTEGLAAGSSSPSWTRSIGEPIMRRRTSPCGDTRCAAGGRHRRWRSTSWS